MYKTDDVVDRRYRVEGVCSEGGGMGALLFVRRVGMKAPKQRVLKYCKDTNDEALRRFKREVRLMQEFKGNNRVMQIVYSNLDHEPPYFVMDHFEDGDLTTLVSELRGNLERQEELFISMIDCVAELHATGVFHRDIKPQNFLLSGRALVISDLGLSTEMNSSTVFTRSTMGWGTPGYLPPEFQLPGGFKNADASSDVFMLGKTIYFLLTGRDPTYLIADGIPTPLMVIIERCCAPLKAGRYQNLSSLKQSLNAAYDVLLHRVIGSALATRTLRSILDRLKTSNRYQVAEVTKFLDALSMLNEEERSALCQELPATLFPVLAQEVFSSQHKSFLATYAEMVEGKDYSWSHAETIASNMRAFFDSNGVSDVNKIHALRAAIRAADLMHRYAAMDTCRTMVKSVVDDGLAQRVHDLIHELSDTFIKDIEPSACRSAAIKSALAKYQNQDDLDDDEVSVL